MQRFNFQKTNWVLFLLTSLVSFTFGFEQQVTLSFHNDQGNGLVPVVNPIIGNPVLAPNLGADWAFKAGTTFHFTVVGKSAPVDSRPDLSTAVPLLSGKRLLIIDSNTTSRHALEQVITPWGLKTQTTAGGSEALQLLDSSPTFDAVLVAPSAAGIDAPRLAEEIRDLSTTGQIPILLLNSIGEESAPDQRLFTEVLSKPLRPQLLLRTLGHLFGAAVQHNPLQPSVVTKAKVPHALRILLAEDNIVNQKVALMMLERLGYRADVVANGLEVLEAVKRQPYDVVLMDVQMPEMDGLEATSQLLEKCPDHSRPRVIGMTAHAMVGDRERCLEAGMDDYLSKPVQIAALDAVLTGSVLEAKKLPKISETSQVIDATQLAELRQLSQEDGDGLLDRLIDTFLEHSTTELVNLQHALASGDRPALALAAHSLTGSSASLGADGVAEISKNIADLAKDAPLERLEALLRQLERDFGLAQEQLRAERRAASGEPPPGTLD
jgi:CheY-like chemotaxis protein